MHNEPSEIWSGRGRAHSSVRHRILCRSQIQPGDRAVTGHEGDADAGSPDEWTASPNLRELAGDWRVWHRSDHDIVSRNIE